VNLDNVSRDDWIVGGVTLLLVIDLLFFPWFHVSASVGPITVSADSSATGSPDGWLGVLAVLASLAVLVDLAIERLSPDTPVPAISGSRTTTRLVLAALAAFFMALKFLFHIHFSYFGWGFYVAVVLIVALVYFTLQARNAPVTAAPRMAEPSPAPIADPEQATKARETVQPSSEPVADPGQPTKARETIRPGDAAPPPGQSEPPPSSSTPPPSSSPPPPGSSGSPPAGSSGA
jgi:hypothetical protein